MRKIDPAAETILKTYGLKAADVLWDCHGTWCMYHRALEKIAADQKIIFDAPQVIEANGLNKSVAICVAGAFGDKREWSIGEAAPGNCKNAYPYAMAEKRAKDRVILKLIGLHGLVYSEEEMPDGEKAPAPAIAPAPPKRAANFVETAAVVIGEMKQRGTATALKAWGTDPRVKARIAALLDEEQARVRAEYAAHMDTVSNLVAAG